LRQPESRRRLEHRHRAIRERIDLRGQLRGRSRQAVEPRLEIRRNAVTCVLSPFNAVCATDARVRSSVTASSCDGSASLVRATSDARNARDGKSTARR
jgi:hypothetical protein